MRKLRPALLEALRRVKRYLPWLSYEERFRFYVVRGGKCYRSAQPTVRAWKYFLNSYGFRSVVILLTAPEESELEFAERRLNVFHIPIFERPPTDNEVALFLSFVQNPQNQPALIHCAQGRDRTGCFCLLYRVELMGWDIHTAWEEMKSFGHRAFPWQRLGYFKKWLEHRYGVQLK